MRLRKRVTEHNTSAPRPIRVDVFARQLTDDGRKIECRCKWCGTVILGSVMDGLLDREQEHVQNCPNIPKE
jgi:hypothetical protein